MATSLLDLNDDCLRAVCKYLHRVTDQVKLAQTCRRFNNLIVPEWERRWKGALDLNELRLDHTDFSYFINTICSSVQSIAVYGKWFHNSAQQPEPDAQILEFYFWHPIRKCLNLKELKLRCLDILDGSQIALLSQLKSLDLEGCKLSDSDITAIFESLKLNRLNVTGVNEDTREDMIFSFSGGQFDELEELEISLKHMCNSLYDVFLLRRLKVLSVSCSRNDRYRTYHLVDYVMNRIKNLFQNRLYYFELKRDDDQSEKKLSHKIGRLSSLQIFKLNGIWQPNLSIYASTMTKLRELYLTSCSEFTDECLLKIVRNCPDLALIDVSGCLELTDAFIWQSGDILLERNSGIVLQIIVTASSLSVNIAKHPDFIRLQLVLKITANNKFLGLNDKKCCIRSKCFTYKFLECTDLEYAQLCNYIEINKT